jgi:hypothetical protein
MQLALLFDGQCGKLGVGRQSAGSAEPSQETEGDLHVARAGKSEADVRP